MAASASQRAILLVGHSDAEIASKAADTAAAGLQAVTGIASALAKLDPSAANLAQNFYFPYRYQLLSPAQRGRLEQDSASKIAGDRIAELYGPASLPNLVPMQDDPFGLFSQGLVEAAAKSSLKFSGERLLVEDAGMTWVFVLINFSGEKLGIAGEEALASKLNAARDAALAAGAAKVLRAGFIFHSTEASRQARGEMSSIGLGSMIGIVLIMLWVFGSPKPIALVLLPIAAGALGALGLSSLIFEKLHLLTLVFGTSIIGVAVDYGVLYVSGVFDEKIWDAQLRLKKALPVAGMAVATSILAYATISALPFPILRQMGAFTILGLSSAWLTAMLWLPLLALKMPDGRNQAASLLVKAHASWPRLAESPNLKKLLLLATVLSAFGILRLKSDDDPRQLYASAPDLKAEQEEASRLLKLPATGQFFLIRASNEEDILEREESLALRLEKSREAGILDTWQGLCQFVPSEKQQKSDWDLEQKKLYAKGGAISGLFSSLGESPGKARSESQAPFKPLNISSWLSAPVSAPFKTLWLGSENGISAGIVSISPAPGHKPSELADIGSGIEGIEYVDHLGAISELFGHYRRLVSGLLALGYVFVFGLVWLKYRANSWRVMAPTLLACLIAAGLFGWLGMNFSLFALFGILLSLDMGVDYGIFMQDQSSGFKVRLLASSLAAFSTLLSFGILALSRTPALRSFGFSVLLGIGFSWLLAPCFTQKENA
jgi:predicted exporter